jgi:nucleoid-associated protein YgaU
MINASTEEDSIVIPEEIFYTIEKGDTLWAVATKYYDDGNKYKYIVEANLEVIKDADLIYRSIKLTQTSP